MKQRSKQTGFTIVELLIVIVVIGILAAITIVVYNGIQQRASNAQRITAAKDWLKGINEYIALNQAYPAAVGVYCIGTSNITNMDVNPDVDCGVSNNIKHDAAPLTATFNSGIKTVRSTLPDFPGMPVQFSGGFSMSGMLLRGIDVYDPTGQNIANYPTLIFALEGADQDCVLRPLATSYAGGSFTMMSSGKNSYTDTATACRVMLPDPTKL